MAGCSAAALAELTERTSRYLRRFTASLLPPYHPASISLLLPSIIHLWSPAQSLSFSIHQILLFQFCSFPRIDVHREYSPPSRCIFISISTPTTTTTASQHLWCYIASSGSNKLHLEATLILSVAIHHSTRPLAHISIGSLGILHSCIQYY